MGELDPAPALDAAGSARTERGRPSPDAASAKVVITDNDRTRFAFGVLSYGLGVGSFLAAAGWALWSTHTALQEARELRYQLIAMGETEVLSQFLVTQPMVMLYAAKAVLVATVASFGVALVRAAERLTMPLARYLTYVQSRYAAGYRVTDDGDHNVRVPGSVFEQLLVRLVQPWGPTPPGRR